MLDDRSNVIQDPLIRDISSQKRQIFDDQRYMTHSKSAVILSEPEVVYTGLYSIPLASYPVSVSKMSETIPNGHLYTPNYFIVKQEIAQIQGERNENDSMEQLLNIGDQRIAVPKHTQPVARQVNLSDNEIIKELDSQKNLEKMKWNDELQQRFLSLANKDETLLTMTKSPQHATDYFKSLKNDNEMDLKKREMKQNEEHQQQRVLAQDSTIPPSFTSTITEKTTQLIYPTKKSHTGALYFHGDENAGGDYGRETKKRRRLNPDETETLEHIFEHETKNPNASLREKLAKQLNMPPRTVQIWFQNKRSKMKRTADDVKEE